MRLRPKKTARPSAQESPQSEDNYLSLSNVEPRRKILCRYINNGSYQIKQMVRTRRVELPLQ